MRKITEYIVGAFLNRQDACRDNTYTDGNALFLFGKKIAEWRDGRIWITDAGWDTATTKERLNGIPGVSVWHHKHQLYLNDKPWDGSWTCIP